MVSNRQNAKDAFREAREMALERLHLQPNRITKGPRAGEWPCIKRVVYSLGKAACRFSLIDWLATQELTPKTYWRDRDGQFEMAGLGAAIPVQSSVATELYPLIETMKLFLNPDEPNLRFWGGFSFVPEHTKSNDTAWKEFGSYHFVVPRFELFRTVDSLEFVVNVDHEHDKDSIEDIAEQLNELTFPAYGSYNLLPKVTGRRDSPGCRGWTKDINAALKAFKTSDLEKIVLARKSSFTFVQPVSSAALMNLLCESVECCYCFLFQPSEDTAFLGASPEQLYHRQGRVIHTEAIAGTRPRGANSAEDIELGEELLSSPKDTAEHGYVVHALQDSLKLLCSEFNLKSERELLKLVNVQHLISRFEGKLYPGISDGDILVALHPTPAVGGYPLEVALNLIRELEPFERGWYAAPVGWVSADAAEFAVGIRSALLHRNRLHLFSGAGIVSDSDPDLEWDEIERKISNFLAVINRS